MDYDLHPDRTWTSAFFSSVLSKYALQKALRQNPIIAWSHLHAKSLNDFLVKTGNFLLSDY
jgi:hypothetical protein